MRCGSFRANGRTVYGFFIGLLVLVRPEFCVAKLASLVVVFSNRLRVFHRFIGLGSPSSFALQNSLVWSLFFRTVYGFFIGLSVLVRPEFCVAKLAG